MWHCLRVVAASAAFLAPAMALDRADPGPVRSETVTVAVFDRLERAGGGEGEARSRRPALAAFSDADKAAPEGGRSAIGLPDTPQLGAEIVVRNWILCISREFAERIAHAREVSLDDANAAYARLSAERSCGQFPELRVILRRVIYRSPAISASAVTIFDASVSIDGIWARGFITDAGAAPE